MKLLGIGDAVKMLFETTHQKIGQKNHQNRNMGAGK
jgi:hypothetical protein